ncbi:glycosyl hydrolase family 28-related protein [Coraliomargarita sp. SDUM461003]|uniref:Glycosyl hydrolase family 28-related protein n=1 Tax=Thalassobacterium maritimum TaxID=3041265 RepID=A0ABU1AXJ7_9BACT|nr:glycosyl hydrolase family 28-related protein [Coraliomargarita sp. SDUM461003]MDQ8208889.1 glycosyl hydrolase family 28-related protein [Coraliomargarita sp. SDUM461003]
MKVQNRILKPLWHAVVAVCICVSAHAETWRSELFPVDWQPGQSDSQGRFLHDFSYAGYQQGAVEIPVVAGPIFDVVKDFAADASGETDASVAIQAAIEAAEEAGGGVVYLPEGLYRCEKNFTIHRSHIVIRGAGVGQTRLLFADYSSSKTVNIQFLGDDAVVEETALTTDVAAYSQVLLVEDASGFEVGDDIDVGWVITDRFVEAHGMTGTWKPHNGKWLPFFWLNIRSIDRSTTPHRVEVDVPIRYPIQYLDGATMRKRKRFIEECGVENLSLANPMLAGTTDDYAQSVRRQLINFRLAKNCWVRDIASFKPKGEEFDAKYHLYDKGIGLLRSKRITVENCVLQHAQRRDAGGHGYFYELTACNDVLFNKCEGIGARHAFTTNWYFGNVGNVYLRCVSRDGSLSDWNNNLGPSDFHHSLAIASLVDSCTLDDGWQAMNRGAMSGGAGHTATESVFWNCDGEGVVRSAQYGWGYLIGLSDSLEVMAKVNLQKPNLNWLERQFVGTEPFDFVEGLGRGEFLEPQSLYEAQLKLRLYGRTAK